MKGVGEMTRTVGRTAAMLSGAGLSLVLLASGAHATATVPVHRVKASCTTSDGHKADFELKYRTSGGYHRVSDIIYRWSSEAPIRLKTAHLRLMVERRGNDRKIFGETLHERHASYDVSYDIIVDLKVPAKRKLYLVVDSTFVKKGKTMRCAGHTAGV
ncbi:MULTISPECIES: hypothetical protein [unclassified Nonomuraea]|uniref:hypothetical protein n=1 Tax=unclassified Nonomuraea TaxID=2593643 RepID=UPI003408B58D